MKATEVFTPGTFPTKTYVERSDRDYEQRLKDMLDIPGQIVSISGPSKSGKTVLVERVLGRDNLLTVTGANVREAEDVWSRILDQLDHPTTQSITDGTSGTAGGGAEAGGTAGIPLLSQATAKLMTSFSRSRSRSSTTTRGRRGMLQVVEALSAVERPVLIDDFHYMERATQESLAKDIKEAARKGLKVITASVPHRSDDFVRANPELRGRVSAIDLEYWEPSHLREIAALGFEALHAELVEPASNDFARESAGSPQLMQALCLNACFVKEIRETQISFGPLELTKTDVNEVFKRTTATTDFRSVLEVLDSGPRMRGRDRNQYSFSDGTKGDVYRCVLKAMASDPPRLAFPYDDLKKRVARICKGAQPAGSSVKASCEQISKLAFEIFPKERVIEWDEQKTVMDVPDPYLLFYMRWSDWLSKD